MNRPTTVGLKYMTVAERREYNKDKAKYYYRKKNPIAAQANTGVTQVCTACKMEKPYSIEFFYTNNKGTTLHRRCIECHILGTSTHAACKKYRITPEQYAVLKKRPCVLCGSTLKTKFDHCHSTGHFRNVLCQMCNYGLGNFKDNPALLRLAAQYVEHYAALHTGTS